MVRFDLPFKRPRSTSGLIAYAPSGVRRRTTGTYTTGRLYAPRRRTGGTFYSRRFRSSYRGYARLSGLYGRFQPSGRERKWLDTAITQNNIANTGVIEPSLNIIPQDNTPTGRIGRVVNLTAVNIRGDFQLSPTDAETATTGRVRMLVYLDKQCNGAAATPAEILASTNINSFLNLTNSRRFLVMADRYFDLNAMAGANDGTDEQFGTVSETVQFYKNCNLPIEYDQTATTGAVATIRSNNVGILFISNSNIINFSGIARVRYEDA